MQSDDRTNVDSGKVFYRPGLDILRFVAFLLVFVAHGFVDRLNDAGAVAAFARAGEFGVCVFFFLSAYLITELLLREKLHTGTVHLRFFYVRRILRIWPLYFVLIGLGWMRGLLSPAHAVSASWLEAMLFLSTNLYGTHHGYPPGFLLPLWSIAIEEQFYLFWPLLTQRLKTRSIAMICVVLLAVAYVRLGNLVFHHALVDPTVWEDSLVQFQFFALGGLLAIGLHGRVPRVAVPLRLVLFGGALLSFLGAQVALETTNGLSTHNVAQVELCFLLALLGCLGLFFSMVNLTSPRLRPIMYLGRISYGLYMFHFAILGITRALVEKLLRHAAPTLLHQGFIMLVAIAGTMVLALLSYRYFEEPFLRLKKRYTVVPSRPV